MKGCNYIKEIIEEADKPDQLPFEVNEHLAGCRECERFASERTALRKMLSSGYRVIAPVNFDAMLNSRLAEVKARSTFSWLGASGYLRLGAAAAGLIVMISAAQYTGLFGSRHEPVAGTTPVAVLPPATPPLGRADATQPPNKVPATVAALSDSHDAAIQRVYRNRQSAVTTRNRFAGDGSFAAEDGGVVLVRGQNGGVDVPMPTVSMGAQPLLYVSAGQRTVRNVGASF